MKTLGKQLPAQKGKKKGKERRGKTDFVLQGRNAGGRLCPT